jgi:hypothetical protein
MLSILKDLPLFDTVLPVALAGLVWTGANILYVGPEIVAPRLAEKTYGPMCERAVQNAFETQRQNHQKTKEIIRNQVRQRVEGLGAIFDYTLGLTHGRDYQDFREAFGPQISNKITGLVDQGLNMASEKMGLDHAPDALAVDPSSYCGCILSEYLGDPVASGLYSTSLRFWKPSKIRRLDQLETRLITTDTCPSPLQGGVQ